MRFVLLRAWMCTCFPTLRYVGHISMQVSKSYQYNMHHPYTRVCIRTISSSRACFAPCFSTRSLRSLARRILRACPRASPNIVRARRRASPNIVRARRRVSPNIVRARPAAAGRVENLLTGLSSSHHPLPPAARLCLLPCHCQTAHFVFHIY